MDSATFMVNAITSCFTRASISLIRTASTFARERIVAAASFGTSPDSTAFRKLSRLLILKARARADVSNVRRLGPHQLRKLIGRQGPVEIEALQFVTGVGA